MKKKSNISNPYNFNFKEEYKIYNEVGKCNSNFHSYTEWHNYVYNKYNIYKHFPTVLINFKHFLIQECNNISYRKDIYVSNLIPFVSIIATIFATLTFSFLDMIHDYNSFVESTLTTEYIEIIKSTITSDIIIKNMYSTLITDIKFSVIIVFLITIFCYILFNSLEYRFFPLSQKINFYNDYISIIDELIDENKEE